MLPPRRFGAALDAGLRGAVEHGRQVSFVFHPFLTEPADRFAVLREALAAVRALVRRRRRVVRPVPRAAPR